MFDFYYGMRISEAQQGSSLVPLFKNKQDTQECGNYKGVKLMNHIMKLWERCDVLRQLDELSANSTFSD